MRILLLYYTGTFNTRYLTGLLKARFQAQGDEVVTYEIDPLKDEKLDYSGFDLLGLGYPIYGFNAPAPFMHFLKKQSFRKGLRVFIYKDSGETWHANDASSVTTWRWLRKCGAVLQNEYHFLMPYNIHFRFDEHLVKEMLEVDDLLLDILVKETEEGIPNWKKYRFIPRVITFFVKIQYIGGDINSFLYRVDKKKCVGCDLCIRQCPTKNIYRNQKGEICFHHHCLMCMRCSLYCPKDAVHIGYLEGWRVNGPYDFSRIRRIENAGPVITPETTGFFECYKETYQKIKTRHKELFGV